MSSVMQDPLIGSLPSLSLSSSNGASSFTICRPWQLPNIHSVCLNFVRLFEESKGQQQDEKNVMFKPNIFKSEVPTRHIVVYSSSCFFIGGNLFDQLDKIGEIRTIYPYLAAGVTIISYFKLSDARLAMDIVFKSGEYQACYANPSLINKNLNEKVFITINGKLDNYMEYLLRVSSIYSLSEANIVHQFKAINLEYDDERANDKLVETFNNKYVEDARFQVYKTENDQFLSETFYESPLLNSQCGSESALVPTPIKSTTYHHFNHLMGQQHIIYEEGLTAVATCNSENETSSFLREHQDSCYYSSDTNNHSFFSTDPFMKQPTAAKLSHPTFRSAAAVDEKKLDIYNTSEEEDNEDEEEDGFCSSSSLLSNNTRTSWKTSTSCSSKRESFDSQASFLSLVGSITTAETNGTSSSSMMDAIVALSIEDRERKRQIVTKEECFTITSITPVNTKSSNDIVIANQRCESPDTLSSPTISPTSSQATTTSQQAVAAINVPGIKAANSSRKEKNSSLESNEISDTKEIDLDKIKSGQDKRTTFMIRNIPNRYNQAMLRDAINKTHFGTYDFLYLRIDFKNKCNVGYAFINFINVESVLSFAKDRVGNKWDLFNSDKKFELAYADIQGKEALIRKFKNSTVMKEEEAYRPKLFYTSGSNKGQEEPFPLPDYMLRGFNSCSMNGEESSLNHGSKETEKGSNKHRNYNHHRSSHRGRRSAAAGNSDSKNQKRS